MTTHDIKPNPKAVNWIRVEAVDGHVSLKRVNDKGEVTQSFMVTTEQVPALIRLLQGGKSA